MHSPDHQLRGTLQSGIGLHCWYALVPVYSFAGAYSSRASILKSWEMQIGQCHLLAKQLGLTLAGFCAMFQSMQSLCRNNKKLSEQLSVTMNTTSDRSHQGRPPAPRIKSGFYLYIQQDSPGLVQQGSSGWIESHLFRKALCL